jgi:NADPH-dependent 2,4-dienoyl-CoA reductase/sulfur reductase-like enzyme
MRVVVVGGSDAGISASLRVRECERYYPDVTGDRNTGRLLGAQLVGSVGAEIAKRIDTIAAPCQHGSTINQLLELDLSYTPPLGSPWDAIQLAALAWTTTPAA